MDGLVTSSGQELGILKNHVWFFLLEGGPGGRECKPPRGLGVYGCGLVIADGVEKAGRDDRLTVRDAPHHLLVSLTSDRRTEFELPGARSWKTQEIRRNLESVV